MTKQKCKGFVLIREYPNCRKKIGSFEPFTTGEFLRYPDIWKPIYESEIIVEVERHIIEIKVIKKSSN
jgi:hypothetical protein